MRMIRNWTFSFFLNLWQFLFCCSFVRRRTSPASTSVLRSTLSASFCSSLRSSSFASSGQCYAPVTSLLTISLFSGDLAIPSNSCCVLYVLGGIVSTKLSDLRNKTVVYSPAAVDILSSFSCLRLSTMPQPKIIIKNNNNKLTPYRALAGMWRGQTCTLQLNTKRVN